MSDNKTNGLELFKNEDDIATALDSFDQETLKETLAYLLKIYVIDKEVGYDGFVQDNLDSNLNFNEVSKGSGVEAINSFNELIVNSKSRYSFKELELFSVEDGKVYIEIDGNKQLVKAKGGATPERPVNRMANLDMGPKKSPSPPSPKENNGNSPARFSNLEMDD